MLRHLAQRGTRSAAGANSRFQLAQRLSARCKSDDTDDTHPDFQPVSKRPNNASVHDFIAADIAKHPVLVYMKGTPTAPQCGFSNIVCKVLDSHGVQYASRNVLQDAALRDGIKTFTNWPTIPQVFIAGEFVGGSDILMGMHTSGELAEQLQKLKQK